MKKLLILIFILFSTPAFAGDYQFYFFGINAKFFREAKWQYVVLGATTAVATHWAGHIAYGELSGNDVGTTGFWKETIYNASDSDVANFGRAGFIAEAIIGLALTSFETSRNWDFTRGYVAMSAWETWSYPIRHRGDGDVNVINNHGGNGDLEWIGYSAIALHNVLRVDYKK